MEFNIGPSISRIGFGFGCLLYYLYNKAPPQDSIGNYLGRYSRACVGLMTGVGDGPCNLNSKPANAVSCEMPPTE